MKRLLLLCATLAACSSTTGPTSQPDVSRLVTVVNHTAWPMGVGFSPQGVPDYSIGTVAAGASKCVALNLVTTQRVDLYIPRFPYTTDQSGTPAPNTTLTLTIDTTVAHVRLQIDSVHYTGFAPYAAATVGQEVSPC